MAGQPHIRGRNGTQNLRGNINTPNTMIPYYIALWGSMQITNINLFAEPLDLINGNEDRYFAVLSKSGVPWQVIAALHYREASCNFHCHLHNGDPLTERTTHVPAGRPMLGSPPFGWEDSALDALAFDSLLGLTKWGNVATCLYRIERYNGLGYRGHGILSPYLWSGSNHYIVGKYTDDGHFDPNQIDHQAGIAGILKLLNYQPN